MKSHLSIPATILTVAIILLISIPFFAVADTVMVIASGTIGQNLGWTLTSDGVLTISGTGSMQDFSWANNNSKAPWLEHYNSLRIIRIENGITNIGTYAFDCNLPDVASVSLPSSLTRIGYLAFSGLSKQCKVYYDGTAADWGNVTKDAGNDSLSAANILFLQCSHNLTKTEAVAATCIVEGNIEYWTCETCGEHFSDAEGKTKINADSWIIAALGHNEVTDAAVEPTCTETGLTTGKHCDRCDAVLVEQETIPALGHAWSDTSYLWTGTEACTASHQCTRGNCNVSETSDGTIDSRITTPATCTETGTKTYSATFENGWCTTQTTIATIPASGHSWDQATYVWNEDKSSVTATRICTKDASHIETQTVEAISEITTEPTCIATGIKTYTGAVFSNPAFARQIITETIAALGHKEVIDAAVEPTCIETGLAEGKHCRRCNSVLVAQETVDALGHAWSKTSYLWTGTESCKASHRCLRDNCDVSESSDGTIASSITTPATCTGTGIKTYSATFANNWCTTQTTTATIPASGHSWGQTTYVWSDDKSSVTASRICENDKSHVETETANTTSAVTTAATCEADGVRTYTSNDFYNKAFTAQTTTAPIPASGHSWGQATYVWSDDKSSVTATRKCAKDTSHIETQTVEATSEITTEPTCTTAGVKTYTGAEFSNPAFAQQITTETISSLGHDEVTDAAVEPTCAETGLTEGKHCRRCKEVLTAQETVKALGHDFGEWKQTTAPTCTAAGVDTRYCSRCDATETSSVDALGHNLTPTVSKAATCTEPGNPAYWTCSRCGNHFHDAAGTNAFTAQESTVIPALGHDFSDWAQTAAPTCTTAGEETRSCPRCKSAEFRPVKATGHSPDNAEVENLVEATCSDSGSYDEVVKCSVCRIEISRKKKTIDKLEHTPAAPSIENEVAGNCRDEGSYDEVVLCAVCGKEISRVKKMTGKTDDHTPGNPKQEDAVAATCASVGSYNEVIRCTTCGKILESTPHTTAKTNIHTPGKAKQENVVAADCRTKTNGSCDEVVRCTVCGTELSRNRKSIPYAHTPGEPGRESVIPAGCTTDGSYDEVVYCTVCKAELERTSRTIEKTGHSLEKHERVEPTDTKAGTEVWWECTVCGKKFGDEEGNGEISTPAVIPMPEKPMSLLEQPLSLPEQPVTLVEQPVSTPEQQKAPAGAFSNDSGNYEIGTDGNATFTAPARSGSTVSVPDAIDVDGIRVPVTKIADNAFSKNKKLKTVTIGNNVRVIGSSAFGNCSKLETVTLGNQVEIIGSGAFEKCSKLKTIKGGANVKEIGKSAFASDGKLKSLPGMPNLTRIGENAFRGCGSLTKVTIAEAVEYIGKNAFRDCAKLKTITIKSAKLTKSNVKSGAFKGIYAKATFKCLKNKLKAYRKFLPKRGAPKTAKYKKAD